MIPFGDLQPSSVIFHDPISRHVYVDGEDQGKFGDKGFQQIMTEWNTFKSEYTYIMRISAVGTRKKHDETHQKHPARRHEPNRSATSR